MLGGMVKRVAVIVFLVAVAGVESCAGQEVPSQIIGAAHVVDGDGLRVGGYFVRLCGIDARELSRPGGRSDKRALQRLFAGAVVRCVPVGSGTPCDGRSAPFSHHRIVAQCFVGDTDLAAEMARTGHALDWPRFSGGFYSR